ncbi:hypothetical protein LPB248_13610 [Flavobacterium sp. LPB0248]|uniref:hypothetical protein n=1 Tax=Flavobacterium sp. LPB0248 TaxID=2614441 RepID=UPI0015A69C90|nr:hypothetical protein [Flavobacterium sp. LPB0248]QLC67300.1 hypothetical protein LPB248_13610 [Flavobacterium sp. LPB0248]
MEKITKSIRNEICLIENFLSEGLFIIQHKDCFAINTCEFLLSKEVDNNFIEYSLKLKDELFYDQVTFKKLGFNENFKIKSRENKFVVPSRSVNYLKGKRFVSSSELKGRLSKIYSESFPLKSHSIFRLILKTEIEHLTTIFLGTDYVCDKIHYGLGLFKIEVDDVVYHIYRHKMNNENYLIIDCLNNLDFSSFKKVSELIIKSIAFLTGNWYQKECYVFAYSSSEFSKIDSCYYESLDDSIISNHEIINPNQFRSYVADDYIEKQKLSDLLFSENKMSEFIIQLKSKPELERTVDLIIEGNGIKSPLIRCSIFSVAMETIVSLIHKENKTFFTPLKSTSELNALKESFRLIISENKDKFNDLEIEVLNKKIDYLNTPFNADKYLLAYKFYQIELPENLIKLLKTRNLFFHGSIPYKGLEVKTKMKEFNLDADRIHLLVSILILKYFNYKGHIKNHAAYRMETENYYDELGLEIRESSFYRI